MPHPLSHKYPIPISQLCLVNIDVPAGVGAPPLDTTSKRDFQFMRKFAPTKISRYMVTLQYTALKLTVARKTLQFLKKSHSTPVASAFHSITWEPIKPISSMS